MFQWLLAISKDVSVAPGNMSKDVGIALPSILCGEDIFWRIYYEICEEEQGYPAGRLPSKVMAWCR
jgi:hypothetical protein